MITEQQLQTLSYQQDTYSFKSMLQFLEKTFNIRTEDCKRRYTHKTDWYIKKGYSFNSAGMAENPAHFQEYLYSPDGDCDVPENCNFKTFILDYLESNSLYDENIVINWKEIFQDTVLFEEKKYGQMDWASHIAQLGLQIFGNQNYTVNVKK